MNEKEQFKLFKRHLIEIGYPEESIVEEYPFGTSRADFVVIDIKSKIPLMVFELKSIDNSHTRKNAEKQLKKISKFLGSIEVSYYMVFPNRDDSNKVEIFALDEQILDSGTEVQSVLSVSLPNYESLRVKNQFKSIQNNQVAQTVVVDNLRMVSIIGGILFVILFLLDILKLLSLESKQLTLLGVAIALFLIPYASKLKILGVEFERYTKKEEKE